MPVPLRIAHPPTRPADGRIAAADDDDDRPSPRDIFGGGGGGDGVAPITVARRRLHRSLLLYGAHAPLRYAVIPAAGALARVTLAPPPIQTRQRAPSCLLYYHCMRAVFGSLRPTVVRRRPSPFPSPMATRAPAVPGHAIDRHRCHRVAF